MAAAGAAAAEITMMIVSVFSRIYSDTTGSTGLTIYRPQCPPGFCSFGDYAQRGDINKPNHGVMICIDVHKHSKIVTKASGFAQVWSSEGPASGNGYEGDYDDEDMCEGSGYLASGSNNILAFWEPQVPNNDYIALGHLATTSYDPPTDCHVCLVHRSVATQGIPGRRLWIELSRMTSLWSLAPSYHYLDIGTFLSSDSKSAPHASQFWSLKSEVLPAPNGSLTTETLFKDDLALIYQDQRSGAPERISVYLPQAPIGYAPLGHYAERGYVKKDTTRVLVVKETGGTGLLRHPVTYEELWKSSSTSITPQAAIWRPVAPPGFFCLGHVLSVGFEAPSTNAVVCLHWSVVGRGKRGKRVWWNRNTPALQSRSHKSDVTIWRVMGRGECLSANTFILNHSFHSPHMDQLLFHCFYLSNMSVR